MSVPAAVLHGGGPLPATPGEVRPTLIEKSALQVPPCLQDYQAARRVVTWDAARRELAGLPGGGGLNIAHEAVDRHARGALRDHVALRFLAESGARCELTYGDLCRDTNRFANVLLSLGVRAGDRVFALLGRVPELYVAAMGALKAKAVFSPLFAAFGPEPLRARLTLGGAKVLVTSGELYRRKVEPLLHELQVNGRHLRHLSRVPELEHVILVGDEEVDGTLGWVQLMGAASPAFDIPPTGPQEPALLHFTSGTTGRPKGALHVHEAVVAHYLTAKLALDFHPSDVFWCTADPGWVTGTSYGIVAPLVHGITSVVDEGEFDPERWYQTLAQERVSVWYTAPTAVRMMMRAGAASAQARALPSLRFIASVGEPLNPDAVTWGLEAFGLPIHDNWWQTETGSIMIANFAAMPIKPGSMGKPLPGVDAAIVERRDGVVVELWEPDAVGELALRPGWPSMFRAYLHDEARYRACFADGWYLSGDLARRDQDGYFWFVGRNDDVIKSAGHLIGPFEVESVLLEHAAVAEAAVIGKPDPLAFEVVKAFVALKPGEQPSEALRKELLGYGRRRLGAAVAPKEITFLPTLPRTRSGKIMRRLLRARELGLPEGDTSTLEASS